MQLEEFLEKNGIDAEDFKRRFGEEKVRYYESYDDEISKFAIYGDYEKKNVNVKDIIGIPNYLICNPYFIMNFAYYFNPVGDTYHSRCNGMLDYSSEEVMEKLARSFSEEYMKLNQIGDKYFIGSNGTHRFHLLKLHYLMDLYRGREVGSKYDIPLLSQELDYVKTYANLIGSLLWDEKYKVSRQYANGKLTPKCVVRYKNEELIMDDSELIDFVRTRLSSLRELDADYFIDAVNNMWQRQKWEESGKFREFIESYLPEYLPVMDVEDHFNVEAAIRSNLIEGVSYGNS